MSTENAGSSSTLQFPRGEVTARDLLWEGGIFTISIPAKATAGVVEGEKTIPYLQFPRFLPGGLVNFFVHTDDTSLCGKKIRARVRVMKKVFADGRSFLYVDLEPLGWENAATHRLVVMDGDSQKQVVSSDHLSFKTPPPLRGEIMILTDPDAKVTQPMAARASTAKASDDPQLDRLITDGWSVEQDNGATVILKRFRNGTPRSLTHHRPKKR